MIILGVGIKGSVPKSGNYNDYKQDGAYTIDTWGASEQGGQNYPFLNASGIMIVVNSPGKAVQALFDFDGMRFAYRGYRTVSGVWAWTDWYKTTLSV